MLAAVKRQDKRLADLAECFGYVLPADANSVKGHRMLKPMSWNSIPELDKSSTNIFVRVVFVSVVNMSFVTVSGAGGKPRLAIVLRLAAIMVVPPVIMLAVPGVSVDPFEIPA